MALSKIDIENMITGEVNVANGGTGLSSGTSGQFLKFTGSTTLASAADSGKVLQVVQATFSTSVDLTGTSFTNITSGGNTLEAAITPIKFLLSTPYRLVWTIIEVINHKLLEQLVVELLLIFSLKTTKKQLMVMETTTDK